MRIKNEFLPWLHRLRKRELDIIFSKCPEKTFQKSLELGAGSGFQSTLLIQWTNYLLSTDYNSLRLKKTDNELIDQAICDAEEVGNAFKKAQFDLVFSSNLLEHLPDPNKALRGIHEVLRNDGITIHVVPNMFWKCSHLLFFLPNKFLIFIEKITEPGGLKQILQKVVKGPSQTNNYIQKNSLNNNPKIPKMQRSFLSRLFLPAPHGVSPNNLHEFKAFSKARWEREFKMASFSLVSFQKGFVSSGYAFGLNSFRRILERMGFTSEYIFIAVKEGMASDFTKFFNSKNY